LVADCIFCKIVAGELPATVVNRTDGLIAIEDINPIADVHLLVIPERHFADFRDIKPALPTHILVIPREHIQSADTLTPEHAATLAEMFDTAQKVARSEGLAERGYRLVFNVGDDALNSVPHLHMHVIGGRRMEWPPG
jgi:histidine triad (HIT) family protein